MQKIKQQTGSPPLLQLSREAFNLLTMKQRRKFVRRTFSSIIQALLEVISLTAIIPLFFSLINDKDLSILNRLELPLSWKSTIILIVLIILCKNLITLWLNRGQLRFIHNIYIEFCEQLYHRFYNQPLITHLQENSAENMRKIRQSPFDFTNHVLQGFLSLITDLIICGLMGILLVWYDFRIVVVLTVLCAPIFIAYYQFRKRVIARISMSFRNLTPKANVAFTQGIDSFSETKIYQKEDFFIKEFISISALINRYLGNLKLSTTLPSRLFETVGVLCFATVIVYAKINPGSHENVLVILGLFSVAMYRIIPSLNRMLVSLSEIEAYSYSILELKESFISPMNAAPSSKPVLLFKNEVALSNVSYRYPGASSFLFENLNLSFRKGEFVVIEGVSGVGKTTLLHLLSGLIDGYHGTVLIDDTALTHQNVSGWQKKLGLVPQVPVVLQETILRNVAFAEDTAVIDPSKVRDALKHAQLLDYVESLPLKLETHVGENGLTLSGGQRLRLVLARALYRNPEVLLLDEMTSQLDHDTKIKIFHSLKRLSEDGTTIILASHDPYAAKFVSRVIKLTNNKAFEIDKHKRFVGTV